SDLVWDNMIINVSGVPGKCQAVNMNMEHLIKCAKELYAAKGLKASWDRLLKISASINVLESIKCNVALLFSTAYHGQSHKAPDTSKLVLRVTAKAKEHGLNSFKLNRTAIITPKPTIDVLGTSECLIKSLTLATFNKKLKCLAAGILIDDVDGEEDTDDLP
ncbi:hypothetical protein ARMGADRAFT_941035, partial [Armillaria gallica]